MTRENAWSDRKKVHYGDIPVCGKCGREYDTMGEGFYWDKTRVTWRRPCKKCIRDYNNREDQYAMRLQSNSRYRKTAKGKAALRRAKERQKRREKDGKV